MGQKMGFVCSHVIDFLLCIEHNSIGIRETKQGGLLVEVPKSVNKDDEEHLVKEFSNLSLDVDMHIQHREYSGSLQGITLQF
jgi:hypothetical protein